MIAPAKGTDRLFVGEQGGKVFSFPNDPAVAKADLAIDLAGPGAGFTALYGLAFHPKFAENRYAFTSATSPKDGKPDGTRLSRFTVAATGPAADRPGERAGHPHLALRRPQRRLPRVRARRLSLCLDRATPRSPRRPTRATPGRTSATCSARSCGSTWITRTGGQPYRDPARQPVRQAPRRPARGLGLRAPQPLEDELRPRARATSGSATSAGSSGSWSTASSAAATTAGASSKGRSRSIPTGSAGRRRSCRPRSSHPALRGRVDHRRLRLSRANACPSLNGVYVYGDYQSGKVWGLRHDGQKVTWQGAPGRHAAGSSSRSAKTTRGELYLLDHERTRQLHRLVPNPAAARANQDFPRTLSQTGLFASTRDHTPAPGVIAYEINAPLWSDRRRGRAVAGPAGHVADRDRRAGATGGCPTGSVLARTVSMELERGNAGQPQAAGDAGPPPRSGELAAVHLRLERRADRRHARRRGRGEPDAHGRRPRRPGRPSDADLSGPRPGRVRALPQPLGREEDDHLRPAVGLAAGAVDRPAQPRRPPRRRRRSTSSARSSGSACSPSRSPRARRTCRRRPTRTTPRPTSTAGPAPTSRSTAPTATSSTRAARRRSGSRTTCRSTRCRPWACSPTQGTFGISRRADHRARATPTARSCSTGSRSSAAAGCRGSARSWSTSGASPCSATGSPRMPTTDGAGRRPRSGESTALRPLGPSRGVDRPEARAEAVRTLTRDDPRGDGPDAARSTAGP